MAKRRYGRRRKSNGGSKLIPTIFKFLRIGALIAPAYAEYESMTGPTGRKIARTISGFGGYNLDGRVFDWNLLTLYWSPYVATSLVSHGIGKLNSIIRRI